MMVADDERGARRQAPVLNIPHDRYSVSADSAPDDDGDNDEQALTPTPPEANQDQRRGWCTPMHVVYVLVAICAVAGAIVGVVITVQYNNLDDNKPSRTDLARPDNSTNRGDRGGAATPTESPSTAPATSSSVVRLFALGSWGADSLFAAKLDGRYQYHDDVDRTAQAQVSSAMALAAEQDPTPQLILSQGNNFNWYGLLPPSKQEPSIHGRVNVTFTSKYNHSSLASIPWAVIMGEHDVGGGRFLCGATEATLHACGNEDELVAGLRHKVASQQGPRVSSTSVSGSRKKQAKTKKDKHSHDEVADTAGVIQDPRWTLHDQYYWQRLVSPDGLVSIDVFHVNVLAGSALSICCQCIGYAPPKRAATACASISSKDHYCAGGNYAFYKSCRAELDAMADESLAKLQTDVAASNATFKIINGHVSPWALETSSRAKWMDVVANGKVHLWLHATTPAMSHAKATASRRLKERRHTKKPKKHGKHVQHDDDDDEDDDETGGFVSHFVTNGVGGGVPIQATTPPPAADDSAAIVVWSLAERTYGFLDLRATSMSLRVQLRTTDAAVAYCVDIDRDTGVDVSCNGT